MSEDVAAAYERVIAAGAITLSPPKEKTWGQTVAYFQAIEGTLIEIGSPIAQQVEKTRSLELLNACSSLMKSA